MTLGEILEKVRGLLNDEEYDFWDKTFLISCINEAIVEIVRIRKDANTQRIVVSGGDNPLEMPENVVFLIGIQQITQNGKTFAPKQIKRTILDQTVPNWSVATGDPEFYVYEYDRPKEIWFYPKLEGVATVIASLTPNEVLTTETSVVAISEKYEADIVNYTMFRALSVESSSQKGTAYYNMFAQSLGIKSKSDKAYEKQGEGMNE